MGSYRGEKRTSTVASAVADAVSDLTSLGEECREIVDNASEGLSQTQRIQTLDETASALEDAQEPDIPEPLSDIPVTYVEMVQKRKGRGSSRATRRDNAVAMLDAAVEALQGFGDAMEEAKGAVAGGTATPDQQRMVGAVVEAADNEEDGPDIEGLIGEIEEIKNNVEGVDFPGMYG